jgi:hypothetical protein
MALACVIIHAVNARCLIFACFFQLTIVNVDITIFALKAFHALALVVIHQVFARSAVLARAGCTLVDISFARISRVPGGARTSERINSVLASAPILARFGCAIVDVRLARDSRVPSGTSARERLDSVLANASILARISSAIVSLSSLIVPDRRQGGDLVLNLGHQVTLFRETPVPSVALIGLGGRLLFFIRTSIGADGFSRLHYASD